MKQWIGVGLAALTLGACATAGGPHGGHGRHGGRPFAGAPGSGPDRPGPRPQAGPALFISPCGQPFRSAPGEPYPVAAWFTGADANHDGALDRAEFRADAAAFFTVLDLDADGVIDGSEVSNYERRIVPEILAGPTLGAFDDGLLLRVQMQGGGGGGGGHGGGGRGGRGGGEGGSPGAGKTMPRMPNMSGAAAYTFLREPQPVSASDGDFDHRITALEFAAAADRRFKLLDGDGDGRLTLATLPPVAAQAGGGPGGPRGGQRGRPPPGQPV